MISSSRSLNLFTNHFKNHKDFRVSINASLPLANFFFIGTINSIKHFKVI